MRRGSALPGVESSPLAGLPQVEGSTGIKAPGFPLDAAAFAQALRTGHGRAWQQVQSHGAHGLERQIIDACLECQTHDPQCEAEKAPWLHSMVVCAHLEAEVIEAIGALVHRLPQESHRDLDHRSAVLRELAAAGLSDARQLLYASLVRLSGTSADVIAAHDIVALDGIEGLVHVARQMGQWSREDPGFWVDDALVEQCKVPGGAPVALAALEREAEADLYIGRYLQALAETRALRDSGTPEAAASCTAEQIVAYAANHTKDPCHWFRRWALHADASELETVFRALLDVQEPGHITRLMRCFAQRGVPRFDRGLLPWLNHPDPTLSVVALRAVKSTRHPALRALALRWIAGGDLADGIQLLTANFERGDFALCALPWSPIDDEDERHRLVSNFVSMCNAHPSAEALEGLLHVYELSPCSTCRREAVKILLDLDVAPDWLRQEARFDADPATRALLRAGA